MRTAFVLCTLALAAAPARARPAQSTQLPGLQAQVQVVRDDNGVAHITAQTERDLFRATGYVHAEDRLWQMDVNRRLARGRLAELVGPSALETDVFLRMLGLGRAADASLAAISWQAREACESFAAGVNAYVSTHALPVEYGALELTHFEPWTASDCLAVAKILTFGLSFELDLDRTIALLSYVQAGAALGFDGQALFFEDLWRVQDLVAPPTVPAAPLAPQAGGEHGRSAFDVDTRALALVRRVQHKLAGDPMLGGLLSAMRARGSNAWVAAGAKTTTGRAMLASDPHLDLGAPSTLYPLHLKTSAYTVAGEAFAGVPYLVLGHNNWITWGSTVNPIDCTDVFQEQVVPDASSPSGISTLYLGVLEHVLLIPVQFRANVVGDGISDGLIDVVDPSVPQFVLFVPRRNGPIVELDPATGAALSIQFTGTYATRELDCFRSIGKARNLADFKGALKHFDTGSQNFMYADVAGNIAYFAAGEVPVREDLQAMTVAGLPPCFVRDGTGGNEWLAVANPQPGQATPHEIVPFAEMPQSVNPSTGWLCNANNDPLGLTHDNDPFNTVRPGGGLLYLSWSYEASARQLRATQLIEGELAGGGKLSLDDFRAFQADTALEPARRFVPFVTQALANASSAVEPQLVALAGDPRIVEAVSRLASWDFTAPTGIVEGYDASDVAGAVLAPSADEIDASVAATLYAVWLGQMLQQTLDAPLAALGLPLALNGNVDASLLHMLERFDVHLGVGASGIDFFAVPGIADAHARRDFRVLDALRSALDLLAGAQFDAAFHGSAALGDYRWGKLHRIVFRHLLGDPLLDVPLAGGAWLPPLAGLDGLPVDGGATSLDVGAHDLRADSVDEFMFSAGASRRFVASLAAIPRAHSSLPGGASGDVFSASYTNLLPAWLTNETHPVRYTPADLVGHVASAQVLTP